MPEQIIEGVAKALFTWVAIIAVGGLIAISIPNRAWRLLVWLLAIASVPAYIMLGVDEMLRQQARRADYRREVRAFSAFCVGNKRLVFAVAPIAQTSIAVIFDGSINEFPPAFNAESLHSMFTTSPAFKGKLCQHSRLRTIERRSIHSGPTQSRYSLCPASVPGNVKHGEQMFPTKEIANPTAPYQLLFGPPFNSSSHREVRMRPFNQMRVRVVDSVGETVLAEDTLFLHGDNVDGEGVCPNSFDQIHELLLSVFGYSGANSSVNTDAAR